MLPFQISPKQRAKFQPPIKQHPITLMKMWDKEDPANNKKELYEAPPADLLLKKGGKKKKFQAN